MKTRFPPLLGLILLSAVAVRAQPIPTSIAPPESAASALLSAAQIDTLLGPIALYPDALIAIILPASTMASDVVLAARYLQAGGDSAQRDAQPWDDSVKSLAHYPDTIRWMDENLAWTKQLGEAFVEQPADVMKGVQRLRARAVAAGTLAATPEQRVETQGEIISIVPAQPDVIYVPYYDPQVVYLPSASRTYYNEPFFMFGAGFATGSWLSYNMDWGRRTVVIVPRPERDRYWLDSRHGQYAWSGRVGFERHRHYFTPWRPAIRQPHYSRPPVVVRPSWSNRPIVQPAPYSRSPRLTHSWQPNSARPRPDYRPSPSKPIVREYPAGRGSPSNPRLSNQFAAPSTPPPLISSGTPAVPQVPLAGERRRTSPTNSFAPPVRRATPPAPPATVPTLATQSLPANVIAPTSPARGSGSRQFNRPEGSHLTRPSSPEPRVQRSPRSEASSPPVTRQNSRSAPSSAGSPPPAISAPVGVTPPSPANPPTRHQPPRGNPEGRRDGAANRER